MSKYKQDVQRRFEIRANILKALSHPVRLMLVDALKDGERCVCELAETFDAERTGISKHLAILKQAGVLRDRKEGLKVYYSLTYSCILNLFGCIEEVLKSELQEHQTALR